MQIIIHCHRTSSGTPSLKWQARSKIRSYCTALVTLSTWPTWLPLKSLCRTLLKTLINRVLLKPPFNDYVSEIKTSAPISPSSTVTSVIHVEMRRLRSQHCWLESLMSSVNFSSLWTSLAWIWEDWRVPCRRLTTATELLNRLHVITLAPASQHLNQHGQRTHPSTPQCHPLLPLNEPLFLLPVRTLWTSSQLSLVPVSHYLSLKRLTECKTTCAYTAEVKGTKPWPVLPDSQYRCSSDRPPLALLSLRCWSQKMNNPRAQSHSGNCWIWSPSFCLVYMNTSEWKEQAYWWVLPD